MNEKRAHAPVHHVLLNLRIAVPQTGAVSLGSGGMRTFAML